MAATHLSNYTESAKWENHCLPGTCSCSVIKECHLPISFLNSIH